MQAHLIMRTLLIAIGLVLALLGGCETNPIQQADAEPLKTDLQFVDLPGFDRALTGSLSAELPQVNVSFYDRISPSALPIRVQGWLSAVEDGGGKLKITPPKQVATRRSPLLLISALTSLWTASKVVREIALQQQFKAAQTYDAEIQLKFDDNGQTVMDKIVFSQRPR
jgi:hypothetical protein